MVGGFRKIPISVMGIMPKYGTSDKGWQGDQVLSFDGCFVIKGFTKEQIDYLQPIIKSSVMAAYDIGKKEGLELSATVCAADCEACLDTNNSIMAQGAEVCMDEIKKDRGL